MKKIILFFIAAFMTCTVLCVATGCFEESETDNSATEIGGAEDVEVLTEEQWKNAFAQTEAAMGKQYSRKHETVMEGYPVVDGITSGGVEKYDYEKGLAYFKGVDNYNAYSFEGYYEIVDKTAISYMNMGNGWQVSRSEYTSHDDAVKLLKEIKIFRINCDVMEQIFGTNVDNATYLSELFSKFTYNETDKSYSASLDLVYGHAEADIKITFKYGKIFKSEAVMYTVYDDVNGNKVKTLYGTENSEFSYEAVNITIPPEAKNGTEVGY